MGLASSERFSSSMLLKKPADAGFFMLDDRTRAANPAVFHKFSRRFKYRCGLAPGVFRTST
jgi:hypothetical protein